MAEPLVITIPHKLGKDEALRRVKPPLGKASLNFPVLKVEEEVWSGDRLDFRAARSVRSPAATCKLAKTMRLEVTLPWLLHKFGEVVQRTIQGQEIGPAHQSSRWLAGMTRCACLNSCIRSLRSSDHHARSIFRHDFDHDDVVMLGRAAVFPAASPGEREKLVTPPKRSVRRCASRS